MGEDAGPGSGREEAERAVYVAEDAVERVVTDSLASVPDWAADVVWYQIFPERFRNGDAANDPTRASLETPILPDSTWRLSPWTGDWYARDAWERRLGPDFYDHGVFNRRYGGDLQGVLDKLPYLDSLGVTGLYFNPVFYARSLHKYDGSTFHHIDPQFGPDPRGDFELMRSETSDPASWSWTAADRLFLRLVREAKVRGMRVIIDGVFNHTGRDFFAFDDLRRRQQDSPYKDWYIVQSFDDPSTPENEFRYKGWWDFDTLPVFADNAAGDNLHPGPKRYVFDITRRWMDPNGDGDASDGIDGWRLDVADEVPIRFWQQWNAYVRELNPAAYTSTEIWGNAAPYLREGGFSATMNYWAFSYPVKGFLIDRAMRPTAFRDTLARRRSAYTEARQYTLQNLVGSHDTDRTASMIVNAGRRPYPDGEGAARFGFDWGDRVSPRQDPGYDVRRPYERERDLQRLVVLFQMTYVGAPMFFYGDEAGMWGADDPDDRKPMLWNDLGPYAAEATGPKGPRPRDENRFDRGLWTFYRDAIALRNRTLALRRGTFVPLYADDATGVFAFEREAEGASRALVVLNPSDGSRRVTIPVPRPAGRGWTLALSSRPGQPTLVEQTAAGVVVDLPGRSGAVLTPAR